MKLIIVGNGFDRAHGLGTSYVEFAKYLKKNDIESWQLLKELTDYDCEEDRWWYQFEEQLHDMKLENMADAIEQAGYDFRIRCEKEEQEYYTIEYLKIVFTPQFQKLKKTFCTWIWSINRIIDNYQNRSKDKIDSIIMEEDIILNFNYTETIESLYGRECYHIHGTSFDPIFFDVDKDTYMNRIVLGHEYENEIEDDKYEDDFHDCYDSEGLVNIEREYRKIFSKKCNEIIAEYPFFSVLEKEYESIDEVIVMGHSLADVDAPYIKKIISIIGDSIPWQVSVYNGNDKEMIEKVKMFFPHSQVTTFSL